MSGQGLLYFMIAQNYLHPGVGDAFQFLKMIIKELLTSPGMGA